MKSNLLKAERELRGWSQSRIAELLGTTTKTVGRWERGEAVPYPHYREQLCTLFGKNAQQLGWLQDTDVETLETLDVDVETLETLDLKEIATDRPSLLASTLTEPWLLVDPAIPQALGKPNSLLGRHDLVTQIKHRLIAADNLTLTALNGFPGIGKTSLAVAVVMDHQVQTYFDDGILWARLGPYPNVLGQLIRWGALLGVIPSQVENANNPQAWRQALQAAIGTRHMLLVIEDAWTAEDALALQVGGPTCAHLLTTHLPQIAQAFSEQGSILVPPLEEADALALLAYFVPQLVLRDPKGAQALVRALNCLPLALTLMGNYLASQTLTGQIPSLQATLAHLHRTEERLHTSRPRLSEPRKGSLSLVETMPLSLHAAITICDQRVSPQAHAALCTLSIFASKPDSFSKEAALAVSQQSIEALDELLDAGLLENWGAERYTLHQAVTDYARAQDEDLITHQQHISSLVEDIRVRQQGPHSSEDDFFLNSPPSLQDFANDHMSSMPTFRPSMLFSWLPLLTLSTTLLATVSIIALVLAFARLPAPSIGQGTNNTPIVQSSSTASTTVSGTITSGTTVPGTNYEAEAPENTLAGGAKKYHCSDCSGGMKVRYIGKNNTSKKGTLQFNNIIASSTGNYKLTIYYFNGNYDRSLYMSVNGEPAIVLNAPRTNNWHVIGILSVTIHLRANNNTIEFSNPSTNGPDLDRIIVQT